MKVAVATSLLSYIVLNVPGCPIPVVSQSLSRVVRDFCRKTQTWILKVTLDVVAEQSDYDLTTSLTEGSQIASLMKAIVDGDELTLGTGCTIDGNTVTLTTEPNEAIEDGLVLYLALEPTLGGISVEESILSRFGETIADGVRADLHAVPGNSWSNQAMAVYYNEKYRTGIADAKIAMNRGSMNANLTAKPICGFI